MESFNPILETRGLTKSFGGLVAVHDVSLTVNAGDLHAIIGPNGAGKTTFFNLVSRRLDPTAGQVFFKGREITHLPEHRVVHLGIGRSFQITNIFPYLTTFENVRLAAQATGRDNLKFWAPSSKFKRYEARAGQVLRQVGLEPFNSSPAHTLSHGNKRKLELAILLAPDPELLLLDEPTAGMASEEIPLLLEVIHNVHAGGGKTILLVEHRMDVVMNLSSRITVMHQGEILAEGTPAEITANRQVQQAYLGELYRT